MTFVNHYDFGFGHVGSWRAGQMPKTDSCLVTVIYDQKYDCYVIEQEKYEEFCEWVAWTRFSDYDADWDEPEHVFEVMGLTIKRTNLEDV